MDKHSEEEAKDQQKPPDLGFKDIVAMCLAVFQLIAPVILIIFGVILAICLLLRLIAG